MSLSPARFALRSRSFGIYAAGLASQAGEWMTLVALNWAVLDLTGSAQYLGSINACRMVLALLFGVPTGVLADRSDRRKLLIGLQAGTIPLTFGIGYLLAAPSRVLGGETKGAGKKLVCSTIGFGLFLLLFVVAGSLVAAAVTIFGAGLASSTYRTMSRVTLQTLVPDRLRGRILSIALMDRGLMPLGAILIGAVAEGAGALWAGVLMGGGCVAVTLAVLAARRQIWSL